ncbi:hypothetical protein FXV77_07865 [Sphingobacterium phlebotomi]|uniref:Uncharacterized protein n=1 Tax=Sphingobacterium phlebotomi TaxID=2605433 RepID=A0A5D4HB83_9SPHI|nr:hypothetical protein [Sphingobacterium phlebotomi]TYR37079.1 hypothetical protein FXV77_07865 [Sphingobacterium phlebotomi]
MKTIVRPHPLKDIILEFDESKEQPDYEKEALERYYEAHNVVWDLRQRLEYLAKGLLDIQEQTRESEMEALRLNQSLMFVEDSLGLSDGKNLPEIEDEFSIDVTGLFQDLEKHNSAVQDLYVLVDDITQRYNNEIDLIDPADEYQEHWPVHGRYFGIFDEVYPRYEELSVNIVSLDDDEQTFLEIYGEMFDVYRENLDFAEEAFEAYRRLIELVDPMYKRASIAMAAMKRKMGDLPN